MIGLCKTSNFFPDKDHIMSEVIKSDMGCLMWLNVHKDQNGLDILNLREEIPDGEKLIR